MEASRHRKRSAAKSIRDFVSGERLMIAMEQFFGTLVLSVMLRNGDAHLKNFRVLYASPGDTVALAPVYDVVTTTAYIRKDVPALTLPFSCFLFHTGLLVR